MPGNLAYKAYQLAWTSLDWLYPPVCGGCGEAGERWCTTCTDSTERQKPPYCQICGQAGYASLCPRCQDGTPYYTALRSWSWFTGNIRNAIHRLKYQRDIGLGEALARQMVSGLEKTGWQIDVILPAPLSLARMKERGYNQAALLARPIALYFQLPYRTDALRKVRHTRPQVGLTLKERLANIQGAFAARQAIVKGKRILVIDDVTTTGATLNACAQALLEAGAEQVFGYTLSRAIFSNEANDQAA